ncbi:hypothetical protein ACL2XP_26345 [Sodalis sp. RH21]
MREASDGAIIDAAASLSVRLTDDAEMARISARIEIKPAGS